MIERSERTGPGEGHMKMIRIAACLIMVFSIPAACLLQAGGDGEDALSGEAAVKRILEEAIEQGGRVILTRVEYSGSATRTLYSG